VSVPFGELPSHFGELPSCSTVSVCGQPCFLPHLPTGAAPCTVVVVPEEFDPQAMVERFRARAAAVRSRGIPPIEGQDRQRYIEQAKLDFMDYAMIGDAEAVIDGGFLTLRVDLRPRPSPAPEVQPP
jgi:hypothetical protein